MYQVQKADVLRALRTRYDFISAQHVLAEALREAKIPNRNAFTSTEVNELCEGITRIGDRVQGAIALVRNMADDNGQASTTPSPEPSPSSEESETKQSTGSKTNKAPPQKKITDKKGTSSKTTNKVNAPSQKKSGPKKKTTTGKAGKSAKPVPGKNKKKKIAKRPKK